MQKVAAAIREFGLADGSLYLLNRVGERFLGGWLRAFHYRLVCQPVAASLPDRVRRPDPRLLIRPLAADEPGWAALPLSPEVRAARLAQGALCLVAWEGESFAGYIWLLPGPYQEDEVRCRFVPGPAGAWDFDLYVVPEHRHGLVFLRLWQAALDTLEAKGRTHSWSRISAFARGSLAAHQRLGARVGGHAWFLGLGQLQLTVATLSPQVHLWWPGRPQPEFQLPDAVADDS